MENNKLARFDSKQPREKLLATYKTEFIKYVKPTESSQCSKVSIEATENKVNNNSTPSFLIKVSNQHQAPVMAASDITVTLVYTATAMNGNDYTGSSKVVITAGTNSNGFDLVNKIQLEDDDFEKVVVSITAIKATGSEQVIIDKNKYCSQIAIAERSYAYFNIEEVTVDEEVGIVEFCVSLSGAPLSCDATVDYIIGDPTTFGDDLTILPSGTLTFTPGITSHSVTLPITDEMLAGYNGVFDVGLTNAVNAIIVDQFNISSLVKKDITDLESALVSIAARSLATNESNVATFMLQLYDGKGNLNTGLTDVTVAVFYSATSINNTDFVGIEQVVIPAHSSSVDFEITDLDEYISEVSETINLKLIQATGGSFKTLALDHNQSSVDVSILEKCL